MSTKRKTRLKSGTRTRAKVGATTKPMPWNGDHGTGTSAATAGTVMSEIEGPNRMAQRRRVCVIDALTSLTLRQHQAAHEIRNAYGQVESLSSGGPLKEWVQSQPKPDAVIAMQVDASSRLVRCTRAILRQDRLIVDHVCYDNFPMSKLPNGSLARFKAAMDKCADSLGY